MSQIDMHAMTGTFSLPASPDHLELAAIRHEESTSGRMKRLGAVVGDGEKSCDFCGITGHVRSDCFNYLKSSTYTGGPSFGCEGKGEGKGGNAARKGYKGGSASSSAVCSHCGRNNHKSEDCYHKGRGSSPLH